MNVIVVVKVKIRTNRLTVMASNLGEKTLVSSFAFNSLLDLLFSANIKKKGKAITTSYILNTLSIHPGELPTPTTSFGHPLCVWYIPLLNDASLLDYFWLYMNTLYTHHNYTLLSARMLVPRPGSVGYLCVGSCCLVLDTIYICLYKGIHRGKMEYSTCYTYCHS